MVKRIFLNASQYQTILDIGITNKVYEEMEGLGPNTLSKQEQDELAKNQRRGVRRMVRILGDIFTPIIPIIAAAGPSLGLKGYVFNDNVLGLLGLSVSIMPDCVMTLVGMPTETTLASLPAPVRWSAFKMPGETLIIGLIIGLMLVSPSLPDAYAVATPGSGVEAAMASSHTLIIDCQESVLTAILTASLGAFMERKLKKVTPNALDLTMTPFLVMLGVSLVMILGVGPIMYVVELKLVTIVEILIHLPFGIGGFLIGATYPLLMIVGLHHIYTMIETSLLTNTEFNPVTTLCAVYGFVNVGAYLAFFVRSKKQSIKFTSIEAMLSQLFGASKPVLSGVQLRYSLRSPVTMLFTPGLGAALLPVLGVQSNLYGLVMLLLYLMYIYKENQLTWYFIVSLCSVAYCFFFTCLFGIPQEVLEADGEPHDPEFREDQLTGKNTGEIPDEITRKAISGMVSPADRHTLPLDQVKDEVFAGRVLGDGLTMEFIGGRIPLPVDGTAEAAFGTGHAVRIRTENGAEVLVHIDINTVELGGKGSHLHVSRGQRVRRRGRLVDVDLEEMRKTGKDLTTMVTFTTGKNVAIRSGEAITTGTGFKTRIGQEGTHGSELL